jgi:hypothetical protein
MNIIFITLKKGDFNMKKIFYSLSALLILFTLSSSYNAFAVEKSTHLKKVKEITDLDILYEKALNGITDNKEMEGQLNSTAILSGDKGTFSTNDVLSTTQKLTTEQTVEGIEESFVTTSFVTLDLNNDDTMFNILADYDKGDEKYDPTKSVKAYSRIYYSSSNKDGLTHYAITKVTGGWLSYDPYVSFKNAKVNITQQGKSNYGCSQYNCSDQTVTNNVSGSTFSYTSPMTSWKPVGLTAGVYYLYTQQTATIYDNSSSWNFTFENRLLQ